MNIGMSNNKNIFSTLNESSLHSALKQWYFMPGDKVESKIDGYVIDLVREDTLIEIQTSNFSSIKTKLGKLIENHKVILVYPIPVTKWIVTLSASGEEIRRRKSPKTGTKYDLFNELIRIPNLINNDNFSLELLMIEVEETRCEDGKGSWRRNGISIIDKKLLKVIEKIFINNKKDFFNFLPNNIVNPFSNKTLSNDLKLSIFKTRKITYTLKKMGFIENSGKNKNELLFNHITNY